MAPQKLVVFKHQTPLGNAPAHKLFERVSVQRRSTVEVARAFSDYEVVVDRDNLPTGIEVLDLL
jgi:CRISPR-associated protein Csd2